jgi:uncharacterized membrane protein HdeD (DUF308 family)
MLIEGLAAIVVGILLFTNPAATTVTIVWFIAVYWVVTGIISVVSLLWDRTQWGWRLAWGIISIMAGWFILTDLIVGTAALLFIYVIILAIQGIILGGVQLVQASQGAGWGRGALGVLSILFGFLLLAWNWQVVVVLPWVFGVFAVGLGILTVIASFMLRRAQSTSMSQTSASEIQK